MKTVLRTKRIIAIIAVLVMMTSTLAACGGTSDSGTNSTPPPTTSDPATPKPAEPTPTPVPTEPSFLEKNGLDENLRFKETQKIRVEVYDRSDAVVDPTNNIFTDFVKKGILEKHNIEIEYVAVGRWTETDDFANLLAAGTAPDVCVTYSYPTIVTYGQMGGMHDIYPLIGEHRDLFPNIFGLLGETNVFWDKDPDTNRLWALEAILYSIQNATTGTFVRSDWLDKLSISEPTTLQQFEDMLVAFKNNADTLLGEDSGKIVPFMSTYDVRWAMRPIQDGFIPNSVTHKERYVLSPVEFMIAHPATKETVKLLNKWFHMGLMWNDFSLYDSATLGTVADDLINAGFVGAFTQSYDMPWRNGENSYQLNVQRNVGPEAGWIAVNPFPNDSGKVVRMGNNPVDRKVCFPNNNGKNDNLLAALLYVDYISSDDVLFYLQYGEKGVHYVVTDSGAIRSINVEGAWKIVSQRNIDMTITINGPHLSEDIIGPTIGLSYVGADPEVIKNAVAYTTEFSAYLPKVEVGDIASEQGIIPDLEAKRNALYLQCITGSPDDFDAKWDAGYNDMLSSGLQDILDERKAAWEKAYGSADMLVSD